MFNDKLTLYRQLSIFDTAVVFADNVSYEQAYMMLPPYLETQPHPGPSLRTTYQFTIT